jgi:hypothetical protein
MTLKQAGIGGARASNTYRRLWRVQTSEGGGGGGRYPLGGKGIQREEQSYGLSTGKRSRVLELELVIESSWIMRSKQGR